MNHHTMRYVCALACILLLAGSLSSDARPAAAGGVVGDGTPSSCTEAALITAMAGGGRITFDCGPAPHTIAIRTAGGIIPAPNTTIDGGNRITLSGGRVTRLFHLIAGSSLTLANIVLTDGNAGNGYGGGILNQGGVLLLDNAMVENCTTNSGYAGGGIDNDNGTVTLVNALIRGNSSPYGGGIDSVGRLTLSNTIVVSNTAFAELGGGLDVGGDIAIVDSVIEGNRAVHGGAGINATSASRMTISNSKIMRNQAPGTRLRSTGGGILNAGVLTLDRVTLGENSAHYGGGLLHNAPSGALTIDKSTLSDNVALVHGGGLYGVAGNIALSNTTLSGNTAVEGGGGIYQYGGVLTIAYATFSQNRAQYAGAVYRDAEGGSTVRMGRSLLAHNAEGNCGGAIESDGYNIADDTYCGLEDPTDRQSVDPLLKPLAANGGPTWTHLPGAGSPAIDGVPATGCPATDQRGQPRPQGAGCDIGAVEVGSEGAAPACGSVFNAVADTTLHQSQPNDAFGAAPELRVGRTESGEMRALLAFDLAGALPQGAAIHQATLELQLAEVPALIPYELGVGELSSAWNEATATWNVAPSFGAGYGPVSYATRSGVLRIDVTALVNRWATGAVQPFGLELLPTGNRYYGVTLVSREGAAPGAPGPRLVVSCAPPPAQAGSDQSGADQRQSADIARLMQDSTRPVMLQLGGVMRFADFRIPAPTQMVTDSLAMAEWFLGAYRGLLRLDDPDSELQLVQRSEDGRHLLFRQRHRGVPVFPAELMLHVGADDVVGLNGSYVPGITLPPTPALTAAQARALMQASAGLIGQVLSDLQLRYVSLDLLGVQGGGVRLCWEARVSGAGTREFVYVDAYTGERVFATPDSADGYDLDLEDGNDEDPGDLCGLFDNDNIGANDAPPDSVNASNGFARVYGYWDATFGRDSYDGDGEQMEVNIHTRHAAGLNASYGRCDLFFFDRGTPTLDIIGHEWTHAVDDSEGQLIYANQSGALDESFADIFGHFVDNDEWLIGEGSAFARAPNAGVTGCSPVQAMRDLSNPPCYGDPDHMLAGSSGDGVGLRPAVANPMASNDNGSVHTNSGIHNKAAYLLIRGGAAAGITVRGIGQAKAERLYYNVLTNRIWGSAQLLDARNLALAEASDLARTGSYGFTSSDVCSVRNAYAAVGLGNGDRDCDGLEDNVDPDQDGDYRPNATDNCPLVFNAMQQDVDGDGLGDACDPDIDGDGRANASDNCPFAYNPGQADWNRNGFGDACDDTDGDSVLDATDNCRTIINANQRDQDSDGIGDACDPDLDGDGRANVIDNCPFAYNPGQEDTTERAIGLPPDGLGDVCDLCPQVSSPDNRDIDGDGLANPCDPDDDNDGVLDGADNCPLVANPSQLDMDGNGVGLACDAAEQRRLGELFRDVSNRYAIRLNDFRLPVPVCPDCASQYLPQHFESVINLQLPVAFRARIVDSGGAVVARSVSSGLAQSLRFRPAPYAITPQFSAVSASPGVAAAAMGEAPPDGISYYLEVFPQPGTDLSQTYTMTLALTERVANAQGAHPVALPLIVNRQ